MRIDDTGTVSIEFANPHGDIVATATVGQSGLDRYAESDEYGQASNPTTAQPRYGWLGAKQRDTGSVLAGLTLMGVRLYNPVTGRFLSIDPVAGGNDNRYTYPADPINKLDLDGRAWWDLAASVASAVSVVACVVGGPAACAVASIASFAISVGARYANGQRGADLVKGAALDAIGMVLKPVRFFRIFSTATRSTGILVKGATRGTRYVKKLGIRQKASSMMKPWHRPSSYVRAARVKRNRVRVATRVAYSGYSAHSSYSSYKAWQMR